jgi:hypothetical protein
MQPMALSSARQTDDHNRPGSARGGNLLAGRVSMYKGYEAVLWVDEER